MKNALFVVSHIGSNSQDLVNSLNRNPRVVVYNINGLYSHIEHLENLFSFPHKINDTSAIYGDHLVKNTTYYCNLFYKSCKFIYLITPPEYALPKIVASGYKLLCAERYYKFRLQRMCEMMKRTPGAVFVEDIEKSFPVIEKYLNLKDKLSIVSVIEFEKDPSLPSEVIERTQDAYERFLYFIKKQDLLY